MKTIYVPLSPSWRIGDLCNPELPSFENVEDANKAKGHVLGGVIAICAAYMVDRPWGKEEHRALLGFADDLWIVGTPDEDGEYWIMFKDDDEDEQCVLTWKNGKWYDCFHGEITYPILGYRPLLPGL
jgi:hypothetical protein